MKFVEPSHLTDPDVAARKLVEIANATEAVQDGRIYIERVNGAFLEAGGTADQYRAALARAIKVGWLLLHESGDLCEIHPRRRRSVRLMAAKGWSRAFDEPIPLPRGRELVTSEVALEQAKALAKAERERLG
jgi:hypothetical protein